MKKKQFNPLDFLLWEGVTGSNLYGMNTATSDWDTRAVSLPPLDVLLDPFENFQLKDSGFAEEDRAVYSLAKFFKLCAESNPNIVEFLFVPDHQALFMSR